MTKDKALYAWFNSFMQAFPSTAVPEDVVFPWMTYELVTGSWESGEVGLTVNLWFKTESEAIPNAKAQELSDLIGMGGTVIPCDGGYIWLKRGAPWCQSLADEADSTIKRRYINISAEYLTAN